MSFRLAYLVSQYPAINHTFILREIRALRNQGFDIEVISIRAPDRPPDKLSPDEQDEAKRTWAVLPSGLTGFAIAHLATLFSRPIGYLRGFWSAVTLAGSDLRAAFFNVAYFAEAVVAGWRMQNRGLTHLHTHFSSTVALLLARVFPITVSVTIHGPAEFDDPVGFYLSQKVAEARFVCTISSYARSQLMCSSRPEHWHKIEVAPLGVDLDSFAPRPRSGTPDRFEILSVGRLAPVKAHSLLINAVGRLIKEGRTAIRLRIAGGGPEKESLAKQIAKEGLQAHVVLEGPCNQERVRELYRETDLFTLASFAEGVPVVLMEAMAMEIACVATWVAGIPELIRHGQDGWLVPPSDPQVLAEAIAYMMDHSDLRERLGRAGRRTVQERYDLAQNTRLLGEIFQRRLHRLPTKD